MRMRYRFPELFDEEKTTPWRVAKLSGGKIHSSSLYRLAAKEGRVSSFDGALIEAICAALGVKLDRVVELDPR